MTPEQLTAWREAVGGRKFWLCVGCAALNTLLFACGILSESGYLMIIGGTVFTYLGVRTTTAIANKESA
jgi:hypothetical protein